MAYSAGHETTQHTVQTSGSTWFAPDPQTRWYVIDHDLTARVVAECWSQADAEMIADALNAGS